MIRNLKALGLAFFAILAMGALMAGSASAQETLGEIYETSNSYPVHIQGEDVDPTGGDPAPALTANNESTICDTTSYTANLEKESSELTVIPTYADCTSGGAPVTVTMNGCHYKFHHMTTGVNTDEWTVTSDLKCDPGKVVEVHKYASTTTHSEGKSNCTLTLAEQTGLTGAEIYEETTTGDPLRIEGTVHGFTAQTHGACSFGFTLNLDSELHLSATVTGTEGKELGITH